MSKINLVLLVGFVTGFHALFSSSIPYAGKVSVNGVNFEGQAEFSFAIISQDGSSVVWQQGNETNATISVHVDNGRYLVLLGGQGMNPISPALFLEQHGLKLRVRANLQDGQGLRMLGPDQPITSTPHALSSEIARRAMLADEVPSGAITREMLSANVRSDINSSVGTSRLDSALFEHLVPVLGPKLSSTFPDVVAKRGSTILLQAPVLSGELLQYQWKRDGHNISGANTATLQITNDNDHEYSVVVSNVFGSLERTKNVRYARGGMSVVSGWDHTLFIDKNGSLWGMGNNGNSKLGVGNHDIFQASPVKIIDKNITAVATGDGHSLVVRKDGSLWGIGYDRDGRLGNGPALTGKFSIPGQIIDRDVSTVSASLGSSYFLKTDGSLWGMGRNQFGELGDTNTSNQHSPIEIADADVVAVSAGNEFVLFIKGDGSLWGTGRNHQA